MGKRQILITKIKVKKYLKKYWWLLVLAGGIGLFGFGIGVYANFQGGMKAENEVQYQKKMMFVSDRFSNTYIEDYKVILFSKKVQEEICADEDEKISIDMERIEGSNCLSVITTANSKEVAKKCSDEIYIKGQKLFQEYYPDIKVKLVEETYLEKDVEKVPLVQMKNLLVLVFPLLASVFIVYIFVLYDEKFYDRKSLEYYIGLPVCECNEQDCQEILEQEEDCAIIVGRQVKEALKHNNAMINLNDFVRKKEGFGRKKILVLKQTYITASELEEFMDVLQLDSVKECKILMLVI